MRTFLLLILLFCSGVLPDCTKPQHLSITAPEEMKALSGSCVLIPCNFNTIPNNRFNKDIDNFGIWSKTNTHVNNVVFDSDGTIRLYPMNIIGDMSQRNCTTVFLNLTKDYSNKYFFRLESASFRATAACYPVTITIEDFPPSPRIQMSHDELKEKESVTITCSALTPCPHSPPKLTWNLQQDAVNNMKQNTDGTFITKIQQTITVSDQHDGDNISCSAEYPVDDGPMKTAQTNIILNVTYAPKDTSVSISPSCSLQAGMWVNLTCSSRAKPPVNNYSWFQTRTHGPIRVSEGDVYSFSLTHDTEGDYYCEATNDLGKQKSSVIHVNNEVKTSPLQWEAVVVGVIGVIIIICLAVCLWSLIMKHRPQRQSENQTLEELPDVSVNKTEEEIHYGQIDFSKSRSAGASPNEVDREHQQETLYAQVKVCGAEQSQTHTGDDLEELYAQVKK